MVVDSRIPKTRSRMRLVEPDCVWSCALESSRGAFYFASEVGLPVIPSLSPAFFFLSLHCLSRRALVRVRLIPNHLTIRRSDRARICRAGFGFHVRTLVPKVAEPIHETGRRGRLRADRDHVERYEQCRRALEHRDIAGRPGAKTTMRSGLG